MLFSGGFFLSCEWMTFHLLKLYHVSRVVSHKVLLRFLTQSLTSPFELTSKNK